MTVNYYPEFQKIPEDLKKIIGDFWMDNPKSKENLESLGLFQKLNQYPYMWILVLIQKYFV